MNIALLKIGIMIAVMSSTLSACSSDKSASSENTITAPIATTQTQPLSVASGSYMGTASVSQGEATVDIPSLYECNRGRNSPVGTSKSTDGKTWVVPAEVNFTNSRFPFAHDLNNPCTGVRFASATEARDALDPSDIIEIDADGEVITGYIFADNYFELYINGVPVGKDTVPFTQFNSNLVQFKVNRPFTVAMKLVDWEENSGIGSEDNQGHAYHPG